MKIILNLHKKLKDDKDVIKVRKIKKDCIDFLGNKLERFTNWTKYHTEVLNIQLYRMINEDD